MSLLAPPSHDDRPDALVEECLSSLRDLWRSRGENRIARAQAEAAIRRMRSAAASEQADELLASIAARLGAIRTLAPDTRQPAIQELAAELRALDPLLVTRPSPRIGLLSSAIAPTKSANQARTRSHPITQTIVRPLELDASLTELPKVGQAVAKKLEHLHLRTVDDLLKLSPRRHIDYSRTAKIGAVLGLGSGEVTVKGTIIDLQVIRGAGVPRVAIRLADETGWVRVTWFNVYLAKQFGLGDQIAISGVLDIGYGTPSFTSPEWEKIGSEGLSTGRLIPVYPLTQGLAQKTLRSLTRNALDATQGRIPDEVASAASFFAPDLWRQLPSRETAYEQLHYPNSWSDLELAQRRLALDNLFLLQLGLVQRKRARKARGGVPVITDPTALARFLEALPFPLTRAQHRALAEILEDLQTPQPMSRLLQGDVGSGKTVVAAAAILMVTRSGYQSAVMAPTEILAEQHFHNLRCLFHELPAAMRPEITLLTGSIKGGARAQIRSAVAAGQVDLLVGTQALIQKGVDFQHLAFIVIDEQHRFGVRQRADLIEKARIVQPHTLAMTATPIPRTLNMVLNGDVDVSIIDELPPGRTPIDTRRYFGADRDGAYEIVRTQVRAGHQVFVICPLVEESEAVEAKAAVAEAERLRHDVFPDLRVALLHGRMSAKDKDAVMTTFRDAGSDILVSTSVIEVGIDVPNATVMLIEGADRFGLSQLHQFRGRVGRGTARSSCLLLAEEASADGEERLRTLVDTADGFILAEKDLELRGPGDFIGVRQSGLPEMSWLDGSFDARLLDSARQAAEALLISDPDLADQAHDQLRKRLEHFWASTAPDVSQ